MISRVPSYVPEGLLLFAVVFGPLAFGSVEPWSRAVLQIDLFLLLGVCALRRAPSFENPVYKTLLPALILLIILGALQRLNPRLPADPASWLPSTASALDTGRELVLWASYASLLWSAPQVLASRGAARRFAWTLFLLGAFVAVVGIMQRAHGNTAYYGLRAVRHGLPFGPYVNRDHGASFLVMSAMMGAGLFLSRWIEFRGRESMGEKTDVAAAQAATVFLLGIIVFGIISSRSRGAVNAMAAAVWLTGLLATGFFKNARLRWGSRAIVGFGAFGYLVFLWNHPHWIGSILKTPDLSTAYRLSMYRGGLDMIRDFPLWGVGLGTLRSAFPAYQERMLIPVVDHLHSDWLEVAAEMGAAGAIVAAAGLTAFIGANITSWRRASSSSVRFLTAGALAAIVAFICQEAVDFSFHIPGNAVIFLSIAAYVGSLSSPLGGRHV